jgi:glycosyltransferase involved in cell wall biosynthesis
MITRSATLPPLRIAIDARMTPTAPGGVLQVLIGMAHGLSQLTDGDEEYTFLVKSPYDGWLDKYLGDNCRTLRVASPPSTSFQQLMTRLGLRRPVVPKSDGAIEQHEFDGIHFLLPMGFRTCIPSFYQIHDLQHLHFPENFLRRTRQLRDAMYATMCDQAHRVFTMTDWGKRDVVRRLQIDPEKVSVVPWGSVLGAYSKPSRQQLDRVRDKFKLREPFAFFPAKAYPHKNHERLLQAIARLRDDQNLIVPIVLSGAPGAASPRIEQTITQLHLDGQVRHLGFVDPSDVTALFYLCRCLVFPSLFEGWGLPLTEAMSLEKPIVCADATCLPEVARDAAVYFDPNNVQSIAHQLSRIWNDEKLCQRLAQKARVVVESLTWHNTAHQFRTQYRNAFGNTHAPHSAAA